MTRRIALSVIALITAVLVLAVVPLGLLMTQREQTSFQDEAAARTRSIASAAEEHLSDHKSDAPARSLVQEAHRRGDCATVYDSTGRVVLSTACSEVAGDDSAELVSSVLAHPGTRVRQDDQWLTTAVPIGDTSDPVGVAVLSRSADPLHDRILAMWGWLALIGVGGLGAAVLVSVLLARWVGRPLRVLDEAAGRLGEGALDARAPAGAGPQEVRRLAATFNTMAARTEALVHGHRAVVADVSHQLRTPLAALRLRLDLLAADAEGDTAAELADAQGEIARLSRLVDGMLAAARAEHAVPQPVPVRVDRLVAERIAAWEPVADAGRVRLAVDCRAGLTAYLGEDDLEQVLDNLIANALDAVHEGGRLLISGRRQGDTVELRVVDNGPGMSRAARESAFRRFGNPEASGTGLGLAIVHRLITANGGTAELLDSPGGGLTVVLSLPASQRRRDRDKESGSGADGARAGA
ncbi:sensor histidine kinase [Streptomyces sp. 900105755]|uniref:sensor histidine kinase n=1 Tax=unclassified Streptomyces TaxID=2593676 RepID=UPI000898676D|nr:HAMP domain-containing sensor histidine kinase [Streptomyces sp. Ag109_O5-10]SEE87120.1 Signal transduction histidine kinase [Streptomyces sp. Ag109_O5-10]